MREYEILAVQFEPVHTEEHRVISATCLSQDYADAIAFARVYMAARDRVTAGAK